MGFYACFAQPFSTFHTETNRTRIIFTAGAHLKAGGNSNTEDMTAELGNYQNLYLPQGEEQITLQGEKKCAIPVQIFHQSCWGLQMCL